MTPIHADPTSNALGRLAELHANEQRRLEALAAAFEKPIRSVFQIDCFSADAKDVYFGYTLELRKTAIPVRVQIIEGTSPELAVAALRQALEVAESKMTTMQGNHGNLLPV